MDTYYLRGFGEGKDTSEAHDFLCNFNVKHRLALLWSLIDRFPAHVSIEGVLQCAQILRDGIRDRESTRIPAKRHTFDLEVDHERKATSLLLELTPQACAAVLARALPTSDLNAVLATLEDVPGDLAPLKAGETGTPMELYMRRCARTVLSRHESELAALAPGKSSESLKLDVPFSFVFGSGPRSFLSVFVDELQDWTSEQGWGLARVATEADAFVLTRSEE